MILTVTYFWRIALAFQYLSLRTRSIDWLCFQAVIWKGAAVVTGPPVLPGSVHDETPLASAYFLTTSSRAIIAAAYALWLGNSPPHLSAVIPTVLSSTAFTP